MKRFQILKSGLCGLFFLLALGFSACSHDEASQNSAGGLFNAAEEAFKSERYLVAIDRYREIKSRFPYSSKAVTAELRIADAYFAQESYIESASAYEVFRELHPTHEMSDYVQYRIGLSYFMQIPDNVARDLSAANKAIDAFELLFERFASSKYVEPGKNRWREARKRLAEHENYVAEFYFDREHFLSASYRYQSLLKDFPKLGYDEQALFNLAQCYSQIEMVADAKNTLERLIKDYPSTGYLASAKELLRHLNSQKK